MFGKKKNQELFGRNIDATCEYCANYSDFDGAAVCRLGRRMPPDGACPRFSYDPLKRAPRNLPPLKPHDPEEFEL
ncbi:MAG: hypothetical protein GX424_02040 [Clostridiales bacterium]|nr:hypothetical protein [Clostridiales bacterium]